MADEWVGMRALLPSDPKTIRVANFLGKHEPFRNWLGAAPEKLPRSAMIGIVIGAFLKIWAVGNSRGGIEDSDCILSHADFATLDEIGGIPGISLAMNSVDWAYEENSSDSTSVRLPNFTEYNRPAEERTDKEKQAREKNRERQRKFRERHKSGSEIVTNYSNAEITSRNAPTEQNITLQNRTEQGFADPRCIKGVQGENTSAGKLALSNGQDGGKFRERPIPRKFLSTLDMVVTMLDLGSRADFLEQVGFLAKVAYADASGFAFALPIWDYVGRAKNKPNPAGWLTTALRGDVDAATWKQFQEDFPSPAHCQVLMRQAHEESEAEAAR